MSKGEIISLIISGVAVIVSIASFSWTVISDNRNRATKEKISKLEGKISKSNYVSRVVFDKIFEQFQAISNCLFNNYNNMIVKLYPMLEQNLSILPTKEKVEKMNEYYQESQNDINELVKLIQTSRFMLTESMIELLNNFEKTIKELLAYYKNKIIDLVNNSTEKFVTMEIEIKLISKAASTLEIFNEITKSFKIYIENLQVV